MTASVRALAEDFRSRIAGLPLRPFSQSPSNAVTALEPLGGLTPDYFVRRLREMGCIVCPNGGELGRRIFRVGHLGSLTVDDNARLVAAMQTAVAQADGAAAAR